MSKCCKNSLHKNSRRSFTLMEILIAMILLSAIAALALPKYGKVVENNNCSITQKNMVLIYQAAQVYLAKNPEVQATSTFPSAANLAEINTLLGLNIPPDPNFDYTFPGGLPWDMSADRVGQPGYQCYMNFYFPLGGLNPTCGDKCQPILCDKELSSC